MSSIYRSIRPASSLLAGDDAAAARGLTRSAFLSSAAREKIAAEG